MKINTLSFLFLFLLLASTAAHAQTIEPDNRNNQIWAGIGYGPLNYSIEIGYRWKYIGIGIGQADLEEPGTDVPDYLESDLLQTDFRSERFGGSLIGMNIYGFWDVTDRFTAYASLGGYGRFYTVLRRSTTTGVYYQGESQIEERRYAFGIGVDVNPLLGFIIGLGYNSVAGASGRPGYRF